jgi:hypothetical protein
MVDIKTVDGRPIQGHIEVRRTDNVLIYCSHCQQERNQGDMACCPWAANLFNTYLSTNLARTLANG